jgi:predicted porin
MILKKTLCSVMVLGAFASVAHAQSSVTVYGIIDAGFVTQSNANAAGDRVTSFQDGQILPSVYGFKGTEDLGGGLKAGFNLEGGFNSSNGQHNSPGVYQSQLFGREAKVTLGADWGTIGAGLQVDPGLIASIATEPRGMTDSFSHLEHWIGATINSGGGLGGTSGSLTGGIFDVNSLTYTYAANGLYVGLEYGFGGVAGSTSAGSTESIGVSYSNGGFVVSGSYAKANTTDPTGATGGGDQIEVIGVGYDFASAAPIAIRLQYGEFKSSLLNTLGGGGGTGNNNYFDDVKSWGFGIDWKPSAANKVNLAYYDAKDDGTAFGGKTTEWALLDTYSLSKRTDIYAQIVRVSVDSDAGQSAIIGGVYASPNLFALSGNTVYFGVGIQHKF